MWKPTFTLTQLQFFATLKTKVTILPNFNDKQIYLMSIRVGPFNAGNQTTVPLWLAVMLKEKNKCKIFPPFWFAEVELMRFVELQRKNTEQLISLQNDQFFQISYIFLNHASDDIQNSSKIRSLIEGLQDMRREKMRKLLEVSKGNMKLVNFTTYQANRIKQPLGRLCTMVQKLRK